MPHTMGPALVVASLLLTAALAIPCSANQKREKARAALPESATLCRVSDLTVQMPQALLRLRVAGNSFAARENSAGVLAFRNGFAQPIKDLAAVWEYQDDKGKYIAAMAAEGESLGPNQSWLAAKFGQRSFTVTPLGKPVAPGAKVMLGGTSTITANECPAQIRVTLLHVRFADGKALDWSAPDWRMDPSLLSAGTITPADSSALAAIPSARLRLQLGIASDGQVSSVQWISPSPAAYSAALKQILSEFIFSPALQGGQPAQSTMNLLLRLHASGESAEDAGKILTREDVPEPLVVVDLRRKSPREWQLFFAGAPFPLASPSR